MTSFIILFCVVILLFIFLKNIELTDETLEVWWDDSTLMSQVIVHSFINYGTIQTAKKATPEQNAKFKQIRNVYR